MKFSGLIGFVKSEKETPEGSGIWKPEIIEIPKRGNITSFGHNISQGFDVNDNMTLNDTINFIADPYIFDNIGFIAYVKIKGTYWTVKSIDVSKRPRLYLRLGGVYNGKTAD